MIDLGPKQRIGYCGNPLERASERRGDERFINALASDARARAFVVSGEQAILRKHGPDLEANFPMDEARALGPHREVVFLGLRDGAGRFALAIDRAGLEALAAREDCEAYDLRDLAASGRLDMAKLAQFAEAKALLQWHARHRYCSNCGKPTAMVMGGWRRDCALCKGQHFPRTDPVVIMLAVRGETCLLGRQSRFLPNMWSCLAGFVEPGENIEEAVRRETREEAGIVCGRVKYLASQPWPFPMTLMIGCHAEALSSDIVVDRTELEGARWVGREEAALMLARKHPDGLITPHPFAIAHHIIRAWVENPDVLA